MDEAGAKTNLTRLRGRAPRGQRLHAKAPHGHWKTTTMLSCLRLDGSTRCMTIAGATDTLVFREYVRHFLCPSLRADDVVIMDNLTPHKSAETLALIAQAGAEVRFLPAYSPDLNPIEKMWSKVKASLRGAEARTLAELEHAIDAALQSVTAQDARGWFTSLWLQLKLNRSKSFYVDYGQYPLDDSRAADGQNQNRDAVYGAPNDTVFGNDQLFNILRATGYGDDTNHVKNPRQVIYVEPRSVKDLSKPQGGISFNDGRWYDPWGTQYVIFLDANYNGQIDGTSPFTDTYNIGNSNGGTPGTGVAVASFGKDKVPGSKTGSGDTQGNKNLAGSDDVTSWR